MKQRFNIEHRTMNIEHRTMNLLVTGGAGFIGSNFIRYILTKFSDYEVTNLDKLTYAGNLENLEDVEKEYGKRYTFVKGDICDEKIVNKLAKNVDCIINFAAESHVDRSILSAGSFIKTDVYGTYILLESARKYKHKKYIQISTDEVYGSIEKGAFTEESSLKPNSPYAASKSAADMLARSYFVTYNLPVVIVRSSNNFGPYQYPEKIIPLFVTNALENKPLPLYGDGKNIRDWLYVLDNCEAINLVLDEGKPGEIYNVAGGNELNNLELTTKIIEILSSLTQKHKNAITQLVTFVKDRPGHDRRYSLDSTKIKKELNWLPKYNFEQALKDTVTWYKMNPNWWKKIKEKQKEYQEFYKKQYHI